MFNFKMQLTCLSFMFDREAMFRVSFEHNYASNSTLTLGYTIKNHQSALLLVPKLKRNLKHLDENIQTITLSWDRVIHKSIGDFIDALLVGPHANLKSINIVLGNLDNYANTQDICNRDGDVTQLSFEMTYLDQGIFPLFQVIFPNLETLEINKCWFTTAQ
jgi:hypothetical protein